MPAPAGPKNGYLVPLPPLPDPEQPRERLIGLAKAVPAASFLFSTLIGFNLAQVASTALIPLSPRWFRTFNREAADTWWGWCVSIGRRLHGVDLVMTGDEIPMRENAIVVINHQNMPDITFMMDLARRKDRLGDMKWMVKDVVKYVPGVGWGMLFIDCVFVKRNWTDDQDSIRETFAKLRDNDIPVWLLSFSEGTRLTEAKLAKSREYAREHGLPEPRHTLVPRTKGFVATVEGLRDHVDAVYDITLGYEKGVPTLWQYVKGFARRAHIHVRRFPIAELPTDSDALAEWLRQCFRDKDELLEHYYREGRFPDRLSEVAAAAVATAGRR